MDPATDFPLLPSIISPRPPASADRGNPPLLAGFLRPPPPDNLPRPASADGLVKTELPIDLFPGHPGNLPGK